MFLILIVSDGIMRLNKLMSFLERTKKIEQVAYRFVLIKYVKKMCLNFCLDKSS